MFDIFIFGYIFEFLQNIYITLLSANEFCKIYMVKIKVIKVLRTGFVLQTFQNILKLPKHAIVSPYILYTFIL